MGADDRYKVFGLYLTDPVLDALETALYEDAGVIDLEGYFDGTADAVASGDPGAEAADALIADLLDAFPTRYDEANFEAVEAADPNAFSLVHLAAKPTRVAELRERFQAAATVRDADLRTVQTAILAAHLEGDPGIDG